MKQNRIYEVVLVVLVILFLVVISKMSDNYNEQLEINEELIETIEKNKETNKETFEDLLQQIDSLKLEIVEKDENIEELEKNYSFLLKEFEDLHKVPYTEEEYETFAHLLYAEAGGGSDLGIMYVGSVVLNRMESDKFPNTLLEVIYQKGQYSPTWHGFMNNEVKNEKCYTIAKFLLENGSMLPKDVFGQADYNIYKKLGSKLYAEVDGNYFFYLKN